MFGDSIMSAIDFELDLQKKEDPKGDRVIITMNGKFLPYKKWEQICESSQASGLFFDS